MISRCTFEKFYISEEYYYYGMLECKRMKYEDGLLIPVESSIHLRFPKIIGDYRAVNLILSNIERNKNYYVLVRKSEEWE